MRRKMIWALLSLPLNILAACATVEPYERDALARPDMALEDNPDLAPAEEHALAVREGASGGLGVGGGGCGCN